MTGKFFGYGMVGKQERIIHLFFACSLTPIVLETSLDYCYYQVILSMLIKRILFNL